MHVLLCDGNDVIGDIVTHQHVILTTKVIYVVAIYSSVLCVLCTKGIRLM